MPPKNQIHKGFAPPHREWALSAYLKDGQLKIDNKQIDNASRSISIVWKNYLFSRSHDEAQRAAIIYTFFTICKKQKVNSFQGLNHTLKNIKSINHNNL